NDLVQYLFAASREDAAFNAYREQSLPVLLKFVRQIAAAARVERKEVVVCGEIAADPATAGYLAGVGIRILSLQPNHIGQLRRYFGAISCREMKTAAANIIG
ncbi:MAG: hypothetical protein PHC61_18770, partial [Chitinivibrionales bacterium]|nr:hypothetical protein [Chitinivibrionales bacterium]